MRSIVQNSIAKQDKPISKLCDLQRVAYVVRENNCYSPNSYND